ncbi:DUF1559 domain-containing protein [Planctopirus hydrillae]|uniref:DUF1559 domain-containing protein n=1 Tax=Planctopirus hydrillae TaxID=1841610 RepID=UPI0009F331D2|nr:DUF1559 domain-containing protein [Planctopirus hydrillae]
MNAELRRSVSCRSLSSVFADFIFQQSRAAKSGFTLIELLVAMGVIGLLIAITIPAVQWSRHAAKRLECQNKLKQIGLALHTFEASHRQLPVGKTGLKTNPKQHSMSWMIPILPHLEQATLWHESQAAYEMKASPYANPPHYPFAQVVPAYVCPLDERASKIRSASTLDGGFVALTSYLGVMGRNHMTSDGVLIFDQVVRFSDMTRGTSQTLCVGERPPSPDHNFGWWYTGVGQEGSGSADMLLGVEERVAQTPHNKFITDGHCPDQQYPFAPGRLDELCDSLHFWSLHAGGGNFLFCDGSVRFMAYESAEILPLLASRNEGENRLE